MGSIVAIPWLAGLFISTLSSRLTAEKARKIGDVITEVRPAEKARKARLTEADKTAIRLMLKAPNHSVVELENTGHTIRISLALDFRPFSEAQLKDLAIDACKDVVAYLRDASFKDRLVIVWLQSRVDRSFVTLYGRAFYCPRTGSIEWEPKGR